MKTKDIKTILKSEADKVEIKDFSSNILARANLVPLDKEEIDVKPRKRISIISKILVPTLSLGLVCVFCVLLFIRFNNNQTTPPIYTTVTKAKELIGYEVIQGTNLIDNSNSLLKRKLSNSEFEQECKTIHKHLVNAEMLMNKEDIDITIEVSDDKNYQYKMLFDYKDVTGDVVKYVYYYNEEALNDDDDDKDIDEVNSKISGIVFIDSKKWIVEGEKEVEKDEYEIELTFRDPENPNSYFSISQETEVNENEYEYKFYNNGNVKVVKQEIEKNEMSLEIKENNQTKKYEFEYKKNGFICKLEDDEEIEIAIQNDNYTYKYKDYTISLKK